MLPQGVLMVFKTGLLLLALYSCSMCFHISLSLDVSGVTRISIHAIVTVISHCHLMEEKRGTTEQGWLLTFRKHRKFSSSLEGVSNSAAPMNLASISVLISVFPKSSPVTNSYIASMSAVSMVKNKPLFLKQKIPKKICGWKRHKSHLNKLLK